MKVTDSELAALVEAGVRNSSGFSDSKLAQERTTIQRYYDGLDPKPLHGGNSKYISTDVYDGVEAMKAQLLETFSGNAKPVQFAPQGADDADMAADATEYVCYSVLRQNPGFSIMRDVLDDGLKCRVGIVQVWWDEGSDEYEEEVSEVSYQDFQAMLASKPDTEITDLDLDSENQVVRSATLVTKRDTSQVRIENVPPEEFGISKYAKNAKDATLVFRRGERTADELQRMGADPKALRSLKDDEQAWLSKDTEKLERFAEAGEDAVTDSFVRDSGDKTRRIETVDAYARMDLDGRPKLWRLVVAGGKLLLKKQAKRLPFQFFTPLPRPHSFWGSSYAKKLIPTQNARSLLTRSIIDHALITNNPRIGVLKGGLPNPKELMEGRIGGIVNMNRPDALVPITQTGLNPFVFQTIALLDDDKEEITGISKLSQGLNKDAISKQNSGDMVSSMVGLSQVRQKVVARNFAEEFLKNLYLEVYRLVVENEKAERIIEVAGSWKPVNPANWPDRKDVQAEVNVGYGERDAEVKKWTTIDTYLAQDPRFAPVYTPDRRYFVIKKCLEAMGVRNTDSVVADPKTVQPPEPDKLQEAEIAVKVAQAKAAEAQATATVEKLRMDSARIQMEHELAVAELQVRVMEAKSKIRVQQEEVAMAREAQAAGTMTATVAPDA